jgi:formate dehydrogenase major subunit
VSTRFTLDGIEVDAIDGERIPATARCRGVEIPHRCHRDALEPAGNCRACVVEVDGERVLAPTCCRALHSGMLVHGVRAGAAQTMVLELLLAGMPEAACTRDTELDHWARRFGVGAPRLAARARGRRTFRTRRSR